MQLKSFNISFKANDDGATLTRLLQNDIREEFAHLVEETIWQTERFFDVLQENKKKLPVLIV